MRGIPTMKKRNSHPPIIEAIEKQYKPYAREDVPIGEYAGLLGAFLGAFVAAVAVARARNIELPERPDVRDVALVGVAVHKLSRIVSRSGPTRAIRAPFTEYEGEAEEPSEVVEEPRGNGLRRAVGELITCPWCLAPWLSSLFTYGLMFSPRVTRQFAAIFSMTAVSDFLQLFYKIVQRKAG